MGNVISKIVICGLLFATGYCAGGVYRGYKIRRIINEHKVRESSLIQEVLQEYNSQIADLENRLKDLQIKRSKWEEKSKEIELYDTRLPKKTEFYDKIENLKQKVFEAGHKIYEKLRGE